jgi:hypothetical protein
MYFIPEDASRANTQISLVFVACQLVVSGFWNIIIRYIRKYMVLTIEINDGKANQTLPDPTDLLRTHLCISTLFGRLT